MKDFDELAEGLSDLPEWRYYGGHRPGEAD